MKKSFFDVNSVPELIESGKITKKEAVYLISEDLQRNPKSYYLISTDEDVLSELRIRFMEIGVDLLENFKKGSCSFKTFICSLLKYQTLTIIRKNKHIRKTESAYIQHIQVPYELKNETYTNDEAEFKIMHVKRRIESAKDKITYKEKRARKSNKLGGKVIKKIKIENPSVKNLASYWKSRTSIKARTALILALKSGYYMTEENLESVCDYCKISKKLMKEAISNLNKKSEYRKQKIEKMQKMRNHSYTRHIQLEEEIKNPENSYKKEKLLEKYKYHTENWKARNEKLKQDGYKISPTNKSLGKVLGIGERQIGNYISNAESVVKTIKEDIEESDDIWIS